jgi:hypothetical protein
MIQICPVDVLANNNKVNSSGNRFTFNSQQAPSSGGLDLALKLGRPLGRPQGNAATRLVTV